WGSSLAPGQIDGHVIKHLVGDFRIPVVAWFVRGASQKEGPVLRLDNFVLVEVEGRLILLVVAKNIQAERDGFDAVMSHLLGSLLGPFARDERCVEPVTRKSANNV